MTDMPAATWLSHPDAIDARGLLCPLPVLWLRKTLLVQPLGGQVRLIASDPMTAIDVPHFCREAGHRLIARHDLGPQLWGFIVERGPTAALAASDRPSETGG